MASQLELNHIIATDAHQDLVEGDLNPLAPTRLFTDLLGSAFAVTNPVAFSRGVPDHGVVRTVATLRIWVQADAEPTAGTNTVSFMVDQSWDGVEYWNVGEIDEDNPAWTESVDEDVWRAFLDVAWAPYVRVRPNTATGNDATKFQAWGA